MPTPRTLLPLGLALLAALALAALTLGGPAAAADPPPTALAGSLRTTSDAVAPGRSAAFTGRVQTAASAVRLQVVTPEGDVRGPFGPFAVSDGRVRGTLPAEATAGVRPGAATGYREVLALYAVAADATGTRQAEGATAGRLAVADAPAELQLENSFVSSVGWVKPGDTYPFTVRVKNFQGERDGGTVTVAPPDGTRFVKTSDAAALKPDGTIAWTVGTVPAGAAGAPGAKSLVVEARARSLAQDPQIVWKNLSATAELSNGAQATSHGPKVIPQRETFDTARYGDRPFPVVPVDYQDRQHAEENSADKLATKINDPANKGSTFNLYQEMSYGQLFPNGTVPSDGIAEAGWDYEPGFTFTKTQPGQTCQRPTLNDLPGEVYKQNPRIENGWYQLPAPTEYYGSDANGSALIGAVAGVGSLQAIDSGCGPTAKAVYDAAQISDPEIDYNDFDTDKDGVVDFFMMVFAGLGGNGDSQINGEPPYDNIWPHSSSLEGSYSDPVTGQKGYVSDDQLKTLEGEPLYWTDDTYSKKSTTKTEFPVHVAVGPYNVNPESAIVHASVISHEYGHSLGLPDFYSTGSRQTYGDWNLMATDHSQNMDVFSRQELGWVVPRVLEPGRETTVKDFGDSKRNTHRIDWKDPDGKPYTLQGDSVANGEAYVAKLPSRQIIDPATVPSGSGLYWSQSGNDFGCPPLKGHNLDIALPQLREVPEGTKVTVSFKSSFDIEWDYDYGFVLGTTDGGKNYTSFPSANGYTTPSENPNGSDCQGKYGNGLTGTSQSYEDGTQAVDRVAGNYPGAPFVDDEYDISSLAGEASALRFTYATDPGLARPGWFIDDLVVKAGDEVLYSSDFEQGEDESIYNGGCDDNGLQTAQNCTKGWQLVTATDGSPADHAYYLEMRDRAGFDLDGRGEDDRASASDPPGPNWEPGLSLVYTDENHGYGNVGTDDPPAQTPLDAVPDPGNEDPDLDDAAYQAGGARAAFSDFGEGHVDNYSDPAQADEQFRLAFGCLAFKVDRSDGLDVGPADAPGNVSGDVTFTLGAIAAPAETPPPPTDKEQPAPAPAAPKGCGQFDHGFTGDRGAPPEAPQVPVTGPAATPTPGPGEGGDDGGDTAPKCAVTSGFKRVKVAGRRRGLRITATPSVAGGASVDVFRVSRGRTILSAAKRVAKFRNKTRAFVWRGKGVRRDGYFVVRSRVKTATGTDTRRVVVRRSKGRFKRVRAAEKRPSCGLLRSAKLGRPVFGGRGRRKLAVRYTVASRARVTVALVRGSKVVRRVTQTAVPGTTKRKTFSARKLRRGTYRVIVRAKSGDGSARAILTARRL